MKRLTGRQLIELIQEQDLDLPVFIQQGEEYEYITAYGVSKMTLQDVESLDEDDTVEAVVIRYQ